MYDPWGVDIQELVDVLTGAPQEVVDQCAVDVDDALRGIAEDRGVDVSEIRREWRHLKRDLPSRSQLEGMDTEEISRKIASSHARLRRSLDSDAPVLARADVRDVDAIFGADLPEIIPMRPTKRFPERFQMGLGGYEICLSDHAVQRRLKRLVSLDQIAAALRDRHPVYYRNQKNRFVHQNLVIVAIPARKGWTVVTVYRHR
jgi:hypothetical protein